MNDEEIIGKLPDPDEVIGSYRKQYASYSRAQLIREMNRWRPCAHQHIAAKQLMFYINLQAPIASHEMVISNRFF